MDSVKAVVVVEVSVEVVVADVVSDSVEVVFVVQDHQCSLVAAATRR